VNTLTPERIAEITAALNLASTAGTIAGTFLPAAAPAIALGTMIARAAIPFIVQSYDAIMAAKPATVERAEWLAFLAHEHDRMTVMESIEARLNPTPTL
jgi:hypothetical protein